MSTTPKIIVTVDTEEEGLWGGRYRACNNTTENLEGLPRFQATCESLGVAPTYLIDAPVLDNKKAISFLKNWWSHDQCEVGAHCHPWCNPPFQKATASSKSSYLCNLPEDVQFEKLSWLTEHISHAFERRPKSYRAGRYGFNATSAKILNQLDYFVDSSVLPLHDYQPGGGPDFRYANPKPYLHKNAGNLVELPITSGFTRGDFIAQRKRWIGMRKRPWTRFKIAGIADSLDVVRRLKLTPEGTSLRDLQKLVDQSVWQQRSTLVLMLHSSSLKSGFSPYSKNEEALRRLYNRLTGIIRYAIEKHQAEPMTLTNAAKWYVNSLVT